MKLFPTLLLLSPFALFALQQQEHQAVKQKSILFQEQKTIYQDSLHCFIPKVTQGFICNFEDRIQRKKIPLDFGLR